VKFIAAVVSLAVLLAAGAYAFTFVALREDGTREVVLVAKNMAFVAEGADAQTPNPTILLEAGERVRLVLKNEDAGMLHDLVADPLGLRIDALAFGESGGVVIRAPEQKGESDYYCSFHSRLMRGRIVVR
jgi:plastocyanin